MISLRYEPDGEVLTRYLLSRARVGIIQGPRGSGKSTGTAHKKFGRAMAQPHGPDGYRHRRLYVVRNTYDELQRTTIKTWLDVFKEGDFGPLKRTRPFEHHIRIGPTDREPGLDWEVVFLALDGEDDRKKLLSTEYSDVWFNEGREIMRAIIDDADGPLGRFPRVADGGCFEPSISIDTNAPPESHWIAVMSGQTPMPEGVGADERRALTMPAGWDFFLQPPGMFEDLDKAGDVVGYRANPAAENLKWLPAGYYENLVAGKTRAFIRINVLNRPGQSASGKPVHPQFRREVHVAKEVLAPVPGHPILIGVDFGRTPAAVCAQLVFNRWRVLRELCAENMGARTFARILKPQLAIWFPGFKFSIWGDPAGDALTQADENSPFLMFRAEGLPIWPAPTNDASVRRGAMDEVLTQSWDGGARLTISPECRTLIAGLEGGYFFRKLQVSADVYSEEPVKTPSSHAVEACHYVLLGAGEGRALLGQGAAARTAVQVGSRSGSVFDRHYGRAAGGTRRLGRPRLPGR